MTEPAQSGPGDALVICVIGAGPRGLSVLERICAHADGYGDLGDTTGDGGIRRAP